jgi:F-type H+-transporting ATPase subunit gamma
MFLAGDADEVYAAYTRFSGTLRHKPAVEKFLNVEYEKKRGAPSYILEPGAGRVLDEMIPRYLSEKMYIMLLNSFTSEHSARMVAMKTATDNAKEMIDVLILMRNKARQAAITKEVIEIASAAEAVRGQYGAR